MFVNNQSDKSNIDIKHERAFDYYMNLAKDWKDPLPAPVIKKVDGYNVVDESVLGEIGSKGRFGDLLFSQIKEKTIVYCQPRFGWAGISLCYLAKKYNKRLILFMPASKEASQHQLVTIEKGAIPIFMRIAAMPNLNKAAKEYADDLGAFFIPLGLKHELVTAAIVKTASDLFYSDLTEPREMWTVISTGVLTRGLQIALPGTKFWAVAVARNIQPGELGRANFFSYDKSFSWSLKKQPMTIDSALNYDAKGLEIMRDYGSTGAYFWNVAGEIAPQILTPHDVKSNVQWLI